MPRVRSHNKLLLWERRKCLRTKTNQLARILCSVCHLAGEKGRKEPLLCLIKNNWPGSISPYWDRLWQDIFHKMMIKQNFKTSLNVCCFVDSHRIWGWTNERRKESFIFVTYSNIKTRSWSLKRKFVLETVLHLQVQREIYFTVLPRGVFVVSSYIWSS